MIEKQQEKVSVIITTCRGDKKILRAINSVFEQTYSNVEIIVVDDNGVNTEHQRQTQRLLERFVSFKNFNYIAHKVNSNGAVARNTGARFASGSYLAFLDDDDFFLPNRIEFLVEKIAEKQCDAAYSAVLFVKGNQIVSEKMIRNNGLTCDDLLVDQSLLGTGSNIFVSRRAYDSVNGFDEEFRRYQDVEFMIRVLKKYRIVGIPEYLVVKDISTVRFYPEFNSFLSSQEQFLDKFKNEISELNSVSRQQCLLSKKEELIYAAHNSKSKENVKKAWDSLYSVIKQIGIITKLRIHLRGLYIQYLFGITRKLRGIMNKKRNKDIRLSLNSEVLNYIDNNCWNS